MAFRTAGFALLGCALCVAVSASALAQDSPAGQTAPGGQGQRGGRGGFGGGGMMGRGTIGTVTEVAADHYTIKTETGDLYTIHFSANTRMMKQPQIWFDPLLQRCPRYLRIPLCERSEKLRPVSRPIQ